MNLIYITSLFGLFWKCGFKVDFKLSAPVPARDIIWIKVGVYIEAIRQQQYSMHFEIYK